MHALIIGATGSALLSQTSRDDRLSLAKSLDADVVDNTGTLDELHAKLGKLHERYLSMAQ